MTIDASGTVVVEVAISGTPGDAVVLRGTSISSVAIGVGSKTFTTQAGKAFYPGTWVMIVSAANINNYMHGRSSSYSGTTLVVDVTSTGGVGTFSDWVINVSGPDGAPGLAGTLLLKIPVRLATTANIGSLFDLLVIDGVQTVAGDRILVKDQNDPIENGIYEVSSGAWTRATDMDGTLDVIQGTTVLVIEGTANHEQLYWLTTPDPDVGVTDLEFEIIGQSFLTAAAALATTAETHATNAATSASEAATARTGAETAETNAETAEANAEAAAAAAANSVQAAQEAIALGHVYASTAIAQGDGIVGATFVAGSGGTDGDYDLVLTGGTGSGGAGVIQVSGGAITAVVITAPGSYTVAPTVDTSGITGLTGESVTLILGQLRPPGTYYVVPVGPTNETSYTLYQNVGDVATPVAYYPSLTYFESLLDTIDSAQGLTSHNHMPEGAGAIFGADLIYAFDPLSLRFRTLDAGATYIFYTNVGTTLSRIYGTGKYPRLDISGGSLASTSSQASAVNGQYFNISLTQNAVANLMSGASAELLAAPRWGIGVLSRSPVQTVEGNATIIWENPAGDKLVYWRSGTGNNTLRIDLYIAGVRKARWERDYPSALLTLHTVAAVTYDIAFTWESATSRARVAVNGVELVPVQNELAGLSITSGEISFRNLLAAGNCLPYAYAFAKNARLGHFRRWIAGIKAVPLNKEGDTGLRPEGVGSSDLMPTPMHEHCLPRPVVVAVNNNFQPPDPSRLTVGALVEGNCPAPDISGGPNVEPWASAEAYSSTKDHNVTRPRFHQHPTNPDGMLMSCSNLYYNTGSGQPAAWVGKLYECPDKIGLDWTRVAITDGGAGEPPGSTLVGATNSMYRNAGFGIVADFTEFANGETGPNFSAAGYQPPGHASASKHFQAWEIYASGGIFGQIDRIPDIMNVKWSAANWPQVKVRQRPRYHTDDGASGFNALSYNSSGIATADFYRRKPFHNESKQLGFHVHTGRFWSIQRPRRRAHRQRLIHSTAEIDCRVADLWWSEPYDMTQWVECWPAFSAPHAGAQVYEFSIIAVSQQRIYAAVMRYADWDQGLDGSGVPNATPAGVEGDNIALTHRNAIDLYVSLDGMRTWLLCKQDWIPAGERLTSNNAFQSVVEHPFHRSSKFILNGGRRYHGEADQEFRPQVVDYAFPANPIPDRWLCNGWLATPLFDLSTIKGVRIDVGSYGAPLVRVVDARGVPIRGMEVAYQHVRRNASVGDYHVSWAGAERMPQTWGAIEVYCGDLPISGVYPILRNPAMGLSFSNATVAGRFGGAFFGG